MNDWLTLAGKRPQPFRLDRLLSASDAVDCEHTTWPP